MRVSFLTQRNVTQQLNIFFKKKSEIKAYLQNMGNIFFVIFFLYIFQPHSSTGYIYYRPDPDESSPATPAVHHNLKHGRRPISDRPRFWEKPTAISNLDSAPSSNAIVFNDANINEGPPKSDKLVSKGPRSSSNNVQQKFSKPIPPKWIHGREPKEKLNLISWLIDDCFILGESKDDRRHHFDDSIRQCPKVQADKGHPSEFQSFDGFFNNIFKTDLGAVDTPLLRRVAPVYDDGVYLPVTRNRLNPFKISDTLMTRTLDNCTDLKNDPCGSRTGKTALLVYFGQQIVEEILDVQQSGCPPEYFNIPIPSNHKYRQSRPFKTEMPFLRSRYSQSTGHSPNNPRQQLNEITPWFDGGLVYGTARGWADVLRITSNGTVHKFGQLASENDEGYFPIRNKVRLPLANPPPPARHCRWTQKHESANVDRFHVLGNPRGNENAFLLSFGILLFRWHNQIASYLHLSRPQWSSERIFQEARKWVIATHQQIVFYNWLPKWLGEELEDYEVGRGYDPSVDPQVEQFFQTAAFRFGHTLVTPGVYLRDYACAGCDPVPFQGLEHDERRTYNKSKPFSFKKTVRTCNIYWRPQEPLETRYDDETASCLGASRRKFMDIDRLLMGMASQRAEREDNMIVEDLRGNVFGTLEFSRRDLMAVNIQRGRDHGTPDYNTAREAFNLPRICSVDDFMDKNELNERGTNTGIRKIVEEMARIHNLTSASSSSTHLNNKTCWNNIDVWTGGILETNKDRPGPLFRRIIKDQFTRIRQADRFWFENKKWKNPRFSEAQIGRIKELKIFDLIVSTTRMLAQDIQEDPFSLPTEEFLRSSPNCNNDNYWRESTCWNQQYDKKGEKIGKDEMSKCFHLPQLHTKGVEVEACTEPGTYDYFSGSEIPFIVIYLSVGFIILGVGSMVSLVASSRRQKKQIQLMKVTRLRHESSGLQSSLKGLPFLAREWQGHGEESRGIMAIVKDDHLIEIRNLQAQLLRMIDLGGRKSMEIIIPSGGTHLVLKNPKEYDCVLEFEGPFLRDAFYNALKEKHGKTVTFHEQSMNLTQTLSMATTKNQRIARLEKFFRIVFAHAFKIDEPSGGKKLLDPKVIGEVIKTELTRLEFADALGMRSNSNFVQKMFDLVDRDRNGFISFREFLDMLIIFAKGTADDKAKLFFEMYDIERDGKLSVNEFKDMIRSLIEAANAEVTNEDVEALVQSMLDKAQLKRDSQVTLEDFQRLLSQYKGTLGYAQLNFSGANVPQEAQQQVSSNRLSFIQNARAVVFSLYEESLSGPHSPSPSPPPLELTLVTSSKQEHPRSKWIGLYRLQIFWCTLYTLIVLSIFAERAYYYSVEREHAGLRQISGYGVSVTRGAASVMMFTYSTLLLTMCRNTITHLRETFLHRLIPFDSFGSMHKYVAILGLLFSLVHVTGHGINFYHISTQTASDLSCLFRDYFRPSHILPKFQYWCLQTLTGITGVLLIIHFSFIYFFSTNYARTHAFRMFWIVHRTYPLWYILMLVHGSARLVQEPIFYTFLTGPLVLFVLDKFVTTSRKKVEIPVIRAEILPSNVTKLEFSRPTGFEYRSGQWVRIACKALNSNEFHPFTLSSAPDEPTLTVHIRAVGPFTANIRRIYEGSKPKLYLEGPYGEGHQDWWRYEVSVLIGGGIGVTPFASILKDVARNANPRNCKKVYFLWVTRTQKQFEWLVDIIREVENSKIISVHVFVTQIYNKFDLRTVLLYICEQHFQKVSNRSLFTGLKSKTHFGRPDFAAFFSAIRGIHPNVHNFGVFSCGPMPMSKTVDEACSKANDDANLSGVIFQHHFENF